MIQPFKIMGTRALVSGNQHARKGTNIMAVVIDPDQQSKVG